MYIYYDELFFAAGKGETRDVTRLDWPCLNYVICSRYLCRRTSFVVSRVSNVVPCNVCAWKAIRVRFVSKLSSKRKDDHRSVLIRVIDRDFVPYLHISIAIIAIRLFSRTRSRIIASAIRILVLDASAKIYGIRVKHRKYRIYKSMHDRCMWRHLERHNACGKLSESSNDNWGIYISAIAL